MNTNAFDLFDNFDLDTAAPEVIELPRMMMPNLCPPAAEIEPFKFPVSDHRDVKEYPSWWEGMFTPVQLWYLYVEEGFHPAEPITLPEADWRRIYRDEVECPLCHGEGELILPRTGRTTGIRVIDCSGYRCPCRKYVQYNLFCSNKKNVPTRFQNATLRTIAPDPKSSLPKAEQQRIIDFVKAHATDSFLMLGDAGTGKTHTATAVMRYAAQRNAEAIWDNPKRDPGHLAVWRVYTRELLGEHVEWENRNRHDQNCTVKAPSVTLGCIVGVQERGLRPCLLLDELDDFRPTPFKISTLRSIIDAIHREGGQVIATSNRLPAWFLENWDEQLAASILRRIGQEDGHTIIFRADANTNNKRSKGDK